MKQILLMINIFICEICFILSVAFGTTWYHSVLGLISIIGWTFCCLKFEGDRK